MRDPIFARIACRVIGILVSHWDEQKLPPNHPYRRAAAMLRAYFEPIQRGADRERAGEL